MNKILLNILIFVGFQQFILATEVNKKIEPKLGICISCYMDSFCDHDIYDTYKVNPKNCENCVKEVYSVCHLGHTMCANCIYEFVDNGLKNNSGAIKCICFNQEKPIGKKEFKPCKELIDKKVVIQIFDKLEMKKKELDKKKEKLRKKYIEMQNNLLNNILFLEPQNKKCKYKKCTGFFDVTKGFICNKNKKHTHCGNCFDRIHKGKCKDPLESEKYKPWIQENEEIHKKIQNGELKDGDIEGYKPCPNCHQIIAKWTGCNHMTCGKHYNNGDWEGKGCGYQWCWRCGKACFLYDNGEPGYQHYSIENSPCYFKQYANKTDPCNPKYFDDGDYFGIKNGNFKKQFKKLAEDMLIDVKVETPTNKYKDIKIINWNSIIEARKKYQEKQQKKHFAVDDIINCCTECCNEC